VELADLRNDYGRRGLSEADLVPSPIEQFRRWLQQAIAAGLPEPNAMTLATCSADGFPSARIVLLRGLDERGFAFFTNYDSRKGHELTAGPRAALVFYWAQLERQVRVEGTVERVSEEESDAYFRTRPRGSQLGACASEQSRPLTDRAELEARWQALDERYGGAAIPRPPQWGGYLVDPDEIEVWQGRPNRLHDRFRYTRAPDGGWTHVRLQP